MITLKEAIRLRKNNWSYLLNESPDQGQQNKINKQQNAIKVNAAAEKQAKLAAEQAAHNQKNKTAKPVKKLNPVTGLKLNFPPETLRQLQQATKNAPDRDLANKIQRGDFDDDGDYVLPSGNKEYRRAKHTNSNVRTVYHAPTKGVYAVINKNHTRDYEPVAKSIEDKLANNKKQNSSYYYTPVAARWLNEWNYELQSRRQFLLEELYIRR